MNRVLNNFLISLAILTVIAALFNFTHGAISDPDGYYHIRHSWIYRTEGFLQSDFPWAQYSAINQNSADIWYGFHILTLPLSLLKNLVFGIKLGGFLINVAALFLVFAALKILKIRWPLFWTIIFSFASADLMYRLTMFRPHSLSLGLTVLLFAFLCSKKRWVWSIVFLISALIAWVHLALAWLPILTALIYLGTLVVYKKKVGWLTIAAMTSGSIVGWLIRPNPLGALKIAYIQVGQFLLTKGEPLRFGRELTPFTLENFFDQLWPIFILLTIAAIFFVWIILTKNEQFRWKLDQDLKISIWSSLILAVIFGILTFTVARRSNDLFIPFAVIFIGLIFSHYLEKSAGKPILSFSRGKTAVFSLIILLSFIYMPIKNSYRFSTYLPYAAITFNPDAFREVAAWLKESTHPGTIVFNPHWDRFAQLFFWNQHNYYINGMDPIFAYAYSPELYWKIHFVAIDKALGFTCGKVRCTAEEAEPLYKVLKEDFQASYIVIEKRRNPELKKFLEGPDAPQFYVARETKNEVLYYIQ